MNNTHRRGIVMFVFLAIMAVFAAAVMRIEDGRRQEGAQGRIATGTLILCENAQACGMLTGVDGNLYMHIPQGVYPVVKQPVNPFEKQYWTMRYIPVGFTAGCWQLDFELALNGKKSPVAYRVWRGNCASLEN